MDTIQRKNKALTIATINCNGLTKSLRHIPSFMRDHKIDILAIQEAHRINPKQFLYWQKENNFTSFTNAPSTNSKDKYFKSGTVLIISNYILPFVKTHTIITEHRSHLIKLVINSRTVIIINSYLTSGTSSSSSSARILQLEHIYQHLTTTPHDDTLWLGDFNLVLDSKDSINKIQIRNDHKKMIEYLKFFDLNDAFRYLHPNQRSFSYITAKASTRIDRIYSNSALTTKITKSTYISTAHFSDHSFRNLISLQTTLPRPDHQHGRTYWKLNDSLLQDTQFGNQIDNTIRALSQKPLRSLDPLKWWEQFKTSLRRSVIHLASKKKRKTQNLLQNYQYQLESLNEHLTPDKNLEILNLKKKVQNIQEQQQQGERIRSRMKTVTDKEDPSRIFKNIRR